jgi:hypothetical protein
VNEDHVKGLVLCLAGECLVALALVLLASTTEIAYFFASLGGAVVVKGVWKAGVGRKKIVADDPWLVIAVGVVVSTVGFLGSSVFSEVSAVWGEIGIFLGLVGGALVAFGFIKANVRQERLLTPGPTCSWWKKPAWSRKEWFALLTAMLVTASVLAFTSSINQGLCGCGLVVVPGGEALIVESYTFNSPTNVTLNIRNVGGVYATMTAYYVKDSAGDTYTSTNWLGPTAAPNALVHANIFVDGNAITFRTGNVYTIIVVTSRNNQFTFTIIA